MTVYEDYVKEEQELGIRLDPRLLAQQSSFLAMEQHDAS